MSSKTKHHFLTQKSFGKLCALILSSFITDLVLANPVGGNVSYGTAVISQTPGITNINQSSQKAIINWNSFNINKGEGTHFYQPSGGMTLNRINAAQGASQIYGTLTATGQIILVNPAGIHFGPSAYVNVGGIIASTANISDNDFLNGNYHFVQDPAYNGSIINNGTIIAANHGLVALIGSNVENNGMIQANLGASVLASGSDFALSFAGNDLISIRVNGGSIGGVKNTGSIIANGGRVMVSAKSASNILDNLVNISGHIEAKSVSKNSDGSIVFSSDPHAGTIRVAANMTAGNVKVTGYNVVLDSPTIEADTIETSGAHLKVLDAAIKGNWLIDPNDFKIGGANPDITASVLASNLNSANVKIQTTLSGLGGNGDIFINDAVSWSSTHSLTLSAYRSIIGNASISNAGSGGVILQADNTGNGAGTVSFSGGNNVTAGSVKVYYNPSVFGTQDAIYSGGTTATKYMLVNNAANLQNINSNLSDNYALGKDIDASALAFIPIGNSITPYSGNFDGQGYRVKNLNVTAVNNAGLFGVNSGSINNVGVSGIINGTTNVGGLVGNNLGTITDTYSLASVVGTNAVGGLIGNNSGTINTSFAAGFVSGLTSGGFLGSNSGTVNNNYWNSDTSGIAGGKTTTQMMTQSTFVGFDFGNTWGINTGTYPYLKAGFTGTPRAISGLLNSTDPVTNVNYDVKNQKIGLISNGNIIDYTQTGANGFYYFLENNGFIADNSSLLSFVNNGSVKANTLTTAPSNGASITGLYLDPNVVTAAPNGAQAFQYRFVWPSDFGIKTFTALNNNNFATAIGNLVNNNLLYSTSGSDINVANGYNFATAPGTFFNLIGNLSTTNGSINFGGYDASSLDTPGIRAGSAPIPVLAMVRTGPLVSSYGNNVNVITNNSGNITSNAWITWANSSASAPVIYLNLNSADKIRINAPISGYLGPALTSLDRNIATIPSNTYVFGGITFSAPFVDQSITTGPAGIVSVGVFNLLHGKWYQVSSGISGMPSDAIRTGRLVTVPYLFSASDFKINSGVMPTPNAEFLRAQGGNGTVASPYLIPDIYSFQGIGSNAHTLSSSWFLNQHMLVPGNVGSVGWNGGLGFVPIGNNTLPFSGNFDGGIIHGWGIGGSLGGLVENWPTLDNVGVFGVNTGTIKNVELVPGLMIGHNNVGALVGDNRGTLSNIWVSTYEVPGVIIGNNNVGIIAGKNSGQIVDAHSEGLMLMGHDSVGGVTGLNLPSGLINRTLIADYISATSNVGGLVGVNQGLLISSFWDVGYTGIPTAVGSGTGAAPFTYGGCFSGQCGLSTKLVDLSSITPYLLTGWDISTTPGSNSLYQILPGQSYPITRSYYNQSWAVSEPIVLSGKLSADVGGLNVSTLWFPSVTYNPNTIFMSPNTTPIFSPVQNILRSESGNYVSGNWNSISMSGANGFFYTLFQPVIRTPQDKYAAINAQGFAYGLTTPATGTFLDRVVTTRIVGGGATGSVTYAIPSTGGGVSNIPLSVVLTPGTPVSQFTNAIQIFNSVAGNPIGSDLGSSLGNYYGLGSDVIVHRLLQEQAALYYYISRQIYYNQDDLYDHSYNKDGVLFVDTSIESMKRAAQDVDFQAFKNLGVRMNDRPPICLK